MTDQNAKYRDFSLSFQPHPMTGDLVMDSDEQAVRRSLINIARTSIYQRPFSSQKIAAGADDLLFDIFTPLIKEQIQDRIESAIENHEPRVDLLSVRASGEDHGKYVTITIRYKTRLSSDPVEFKFYLNRVL